MAKSLEDTLSQDLVKRIGYAAAKEAVKIRSETGIRMRVTLYCSYSNAAIHRFAVRLTKDEDYFTRGGFIPASFILEPSDYNAGGTKDGQDDIHD